MYVQTLEDGALVLLRNVGNHIQFACLSLHDFEQPKNAVLNLKPLYGTRK